MKAVITSSIVILAIVLSSSTVFAEKSKEPVTVANFVRAESDHMIRANMKALGVGFANLRHRARPPRRTTSPSSP